MRLCIVVSTDENVLSNGSTLSAISREPGQTGESGYITRTEFDSGRITVARREDDRGQTIIFAQCVPGKPFRPFDHRNQLGAPYTAVRVLIPEPPSDDPVNNCPAGANQNASGICQCRRGAELDPYTNQCVCKLPATGFPDNCLCPGNNWLVNLCVPLPCGQNQIPQNGGCVCSPGFYGNCTQCVACPTINNPPVMTCPNPS